MYGGYGQPWRMPVNPAPQQSNSQRPFVASDPSSLNHIGGNSADDISSSDLKILGSQQQADLLEAHSKKLQEDLEDVGRKIKHHEDNLQYLKTLRTKLDETIMDKQAFLESYEKSGIVKTMEGDPAYLENEGKTIENILKYENSAAALCFRLKKLAEAKPSDPSLTKDVIGVVATLGKVDDLNLSRLLSKYLGLDLMLAVVCKTYEGVKTLEVHKRGGLVDKDLGIHAYAASTQTPLVDQFKVICLEDIRPYDGAFVEDDPQCSLALLKPRLPNGETPPGFLGFAVNMINIDRDDLHYISKNKHNLRESLFYHLFSNLQVYRSWEDMFQARPCISNGAISLDGGTIRRPGEFDLGLNQEDIDVKFPVGTKMSNHLEIVEEIKETKWKRIRTIEDIHIEERLLDHAKLSYEIKKGATIKFLTENSPRLFQTQAVHFRCGCSGIPDFDEDERMVLQPLKTC